MDVDIIFMDLLVRPFGKKFSHDLLFSLIGTDHLNQPAAFFMDLFA